MGRVRRTHKSNKVRISLYVRELYEQLWGRLLAIGRSTQFAQSSFV
jgi:hypothetical protein